MEQNPYWITNRINSNDKRTRAIASLTANVKITDWLNIQARGTADYTHDQKVIPFFVYPSHDVAVIQCFSMIQVDVTAVLPR